VVNAGERAYLFPFKTGDQRKKSSPGKKPTPSLRGLEKWLSGPYIQSHTNGYRRYGVITG
jgi:hypothetical protein